MNDVSIAIIGAGVVGLAIAQELAEEYENVFLIERNKTFGQETSSRNSEVIHAGIYYPENSLKAKLCVEGRKLLYEFCDNFEVPYNQCGKLIVATCQEEVNHLKELKEKAVNNGVEDIRMIESTEIKQLEPEIKAVKALFSPSTGIVDTHTLMKQMETNAVNKGAEFAYHAEVKNINRIENGYQIELLDADGGFFSFTSDCVINAAGLNADQIARMVGIEDDGLKLTFCKGEYFRINPPKNKLINRLVYPVPNKNLEGIGIHVTVDLGGMAKLGPDVTWLESNEYDYSVTHSRKETFYKSAKRFLPFLNLEDLAPEMAGIRPKLQRSGGPVKDFYIREEKDRGFQGFINLIGIESPGLTSSLAIARHVQNLI